MSEEKSIFTKYIINAFGTDICWSFFTEKEKEIWTLYKKFKKNESEFEENILSPIQVNNEDIMSCSNTKIKNYYQLCEKMYN